METRETERLILRPFERSDAGAFLRLASDPQIIRFVGGTPLKDVAEAEAMLEKGPLLDYETHGYGRFACILKTTGDLVGFSGIKFIKEVQDTELGYRFWPELWGQGLATEAGRGSLEFAADIGFDRVISLVDVENLASARVLQKLGFVREGKMDVSFWHKGGEVDLYGIALQPRAKPA
jgi:RimJ/RimL family protein N-acetyltransferase